MRLAASLFSRSAISSAFFGGTANVYGPSRPAGGTATSATGPGAASRSDPAGRAVQMAVDADHRKNDDGGRFADPPPLTWVLRDTLFQGESDHQSHAALPLVRALCRRLPHIKNRTWLTLR